MEKKTKIKNPNHDDDKNILKNDDLNRKTR